MTEEQKRKIVTWLYSSSNLGYKKRAYVRKILGLSS